MKNPAKLYKLCASFLRWLYPFLIFVGVMAAASRSLDRSTMDIPPSSTSFSVFPLQ